MGFWVAFAMFVVSTVVSAVLAPKPKDAEPSSLGEFQVPTAEEGRPHSIILGTCKVKAPNITWWGALRTEAIKRVANALTGSRTTIGYRYRLGMQQCLGIGPIDELIDIVVGGKSLKEAGATIPSSYAAAGLDLSINLPDLFGGDEKEGGLAGAIRFYFGSDTQGGDAYLASQFGSPAPAWRGICYAVLKDFYLGTSNYPKEWAWVLRRCPCPDGFDPAKRNISGDANAAYGLAFILTLSREMGGCGESLGTLDTASFQAAANTLYAEGFGISLLMDRAQNADAWMGEILRHIDGVLYTDPSTGLTCLKLIRADYDPATLPEFVESDMQAAPEVTLAAPPDTLNRVVIRYTDRAQGFTVRTAQDQDAGNYWARGEGSDTTLDFLALSSPVTAQLVAAREIRGLASPLAKGTLHLNRKGWQLRPGSPFKLTFAPHDWQGLICRVTNIRYGTLGAGKITVEFAQDVFAVGSQSYAPPQPSSWVDPVTPPQACVAQALVETPHWLVGESRQVIAMGARGDQITLGAEVWTNEGAGYLLTGLLPSMTPTGLLSAPYSAKTPALDTTGFVVGGGSDLGALPGLNTNSDGRARGVNLAWFPATGELVSWTTATDNGNGTYTISGGVLRGVMDTVPADHSLGERVWFLSLGGASVQSVDGGASPGGGPSSYARGYTWRGPWSSATAYVVDDTVSRNGSSYVCIQPCTSQDPAISPTFWDLMAQKGADGTGGGAGAGYTYWDPNKPPGFPSALDDEFNGSLLDAKWTTINWGSPTIKDVNTTSPGRLHIASSGTGNTLMAILQSLPAGDFIAFCHVANLGVVPSPNIMTGLVLTNGVTPGSGSQLFWASQAFSNYQEFVTLFAWTNFATIGTSPTGAVYAKANQYLAIRRVGSAYSWGWSPDGITWNWVASNPGFTPTHIGLCHVANQASVGVSAFEFFRYFNSSTAVLGASRS